MEKIMPNLSLLINLMLQSYIERIPQLLREEVKELLERGESPPDPEEGNAD